MTQEQIIKANEWRIKHKKHVDSLFSAGQRNFYEPTGSDASSPEIWKAEHWRWFLIHA